MKYIVDIPEEIVESVKYGNVYIAGTRRNGKTIFCKITDAIANGTPLPKGHGRLIDADKLKCIRPQDVAFHKVLQHSKTIIKADKENDNEVYN